VRNNKPLILITDDEKAIRNTLRDILEYEGYEVIEAVNGSECLDIAREDIPDLILLDIKMKGMDGIQVLENLKNKGFELPVIMISGHGNIKLAVEATKKGAFDFIEKPPDLNRLLVSVRNALSQGQLTKQIEQVKSRLPKVPEIVGESKAVKQLKAKIDKVAPTNARVLITGENGTGKELIAKWIHEKSARSSAPFVEINCAAIPSELLESELFGHEKGAFTGATDQRTGKFEQADGGTLFLDEIGDMSIDAQAKVLRVLEENTVTRVGGNKAKRIDVRVLAATNKNLKQQIKDKQFREDLYHRLNVIPIHSPPLRERKEDIPLLIESFLEDLSATNIMFSGLSFSNDAIDELKKLHWSGNIRELRNAIERLAVLSNNNQVTVEDINSVININNDDAEGDLKSLAESENTFQAFKERAERLFLLHHLKKNDWNISQTAEEIDIQRSHIYNKMKKYNIER